ncbi:SAF domain-containing protein [Corynebacterium senegalense]|uniref:SAF domain-containing protein n=1 Tax=Corynebacterium senegalense TaxID=2080750 RepID=UPI000E2055C9|nr:SAF domain-containing protein [Corynebacterium senegalense]
MKLVEVLRTPSHRRATLLRRCLALVLVALAGVSAAAARRSDPLVAVFARDIEAGSTVSLSDLELRRVPAEAVPANALASAEEAEAKVLGAAASAGEVATSTRFVGPDLAAALAPEGHGYTMVPVALAEPEILPLLHHGAFVRVITVAPDTGAALTVANGGRVVVTHSENGTVLLLLRATEAPAVAAASLNSPLTLVLEGPAH